MQSERTPCLDLSCRKKEDAYYVVTDRWQKFTEEKVSLELMEKLGAYCDEFLIHAVDVEGKAKGIEVALAKLLGEYNGTQSLTLAALAAWRISRPSKWQQAENWM